MDISIVPVLNSELKKSIQYFIFFRKRSLNTYHYTTFPNINLCLSLYKSNKVNHIVNSTQNVCYITPANIATSRFFGFHERPFNVSISGLLDQVCILFAPGALKEFTKHDYRKAVISDNPFLDLMRYSTEHMDNLFSIACNHQRAAYLEQLLLDRKVARGISNTTRAILDDLARYRESTFQINDVARKHEVSNSTIFRRFINDIGQSPKVFSRTSRFRNTLDYMIHNDATSQTEIAYKHAFSDQSHFIKEFRKFTNLSPKRFFNNSLYKRGELILLSN